MEVPKLNKEINGNASAAFLESVKTTADIYMPSDGKIVAANK